MTALFLTQPTGSAGNIINNNDIDNCNENIICVYVYTYFLLLKEDFYVSMHIYP